MWLWTNMGYVVMDTEKHHFENTDFIWKRYGSKIVTFEVVFLSVDEDGIENQHNLCWPATI